jgi:hypothetical protein
VRNALDRARLRQASRLFAERDRRLTREDLCTITAPDLLGSRLFATPDAGEAGAATNSHLRRPPCPSPTAGP